MFRDEWYGQINYLEKQNQSREYLGVQYCLFYYPTMYVYFGLS